MAGPDNWIGRDDGILRARLETGTADPMDLDVRVMLVTTESEVGGKTYRETFPVLEIAGFNAHDMYRFATPGTSWSEEDVVEAEELGHVDISEAERSD